MVSVGLSTSTDFSPNASAVVEDQATQLTFTFTLDEAAPTGGLKVYVDSDVPEILNRLNPQALLFNPGLASGLTISQSGFTDFSNSGFSVIINAGETEASLTLPVFDTDEGDPDPFFPDTYDGLTTTTFTLKTRDQIDTAEETSPRTGSMGNDLDSIEFDNIPVGDYTISGDPSSVVLFADTASQLPAPTLPTFRISASETTLIEDEGTSTTLTIELVDGELPPGGVSLNIGTGIPGALGDFLVFPPDASFSGGFPTSGFPDSSGLVFSVQAETATITVPIFDDPDRPQSDPDSTVNDDIGVEQVTFAIQPGDGYEVDSQNGEVTLTLADTASQLITTPIVSFSIDPATVSEADGTTAVLNFTVEGEIPAGGITVGLQGDTSGILQEFTAAQTRFEDDGLIYFFETATIDNVTGGVLESEALEDNPSDPGFLSDFTFTITDSTASITLAVLDDVIDEADDSFTYTLLEGDGYEVNPSASSDSFTVTDGVPGGGPTIGVTAEPTALFENSQTRIELTFTVDGTLPPEGVVVILDGDVPRAIAEFDVTASNPRDPEDTITVDGPIVNGGNIVGTNELASALLFRITEQTATLSVEVFDDDDNEGQESFTYTLLDGEGYEVDSSNSAINITIEDGFAPVVNVDPVADDDTTTTEEDQAVTIDVLANDTDADGDVLSVSAVGDASNGDVVINNDGTVTYTPDAGFDGVDSFDYTVSDGEGGDDTGTVTVTVNDGNVAPEAIDDTAATEEDQAVTIDVLANDTDANGDVLSVSAVGDASNGDVVINNDGTVTYTPDAGFDGTDSFEYTVSDGNGGDDTGTVTVTVTDDDVPPVAVDDMAETGENQAVTIDVLANDTDANGDVLSVSAVGDASNGDVVINNDGTVTYTPDADFIGDDSFEYTVSDGNGGTDTGSVAVTVDEITVSDPVVSFVTTTPVVTEDEQPVAEFVFTIDGPIPDDGQGVVVTIGGEGIEKLFAPRFLDGNVPLAFDPADGVVPISFTGTEVILGFTAPEVTARATIFDDIIEEESEVLSFEILPGEGYTIDQGTASITVEDGDSATPGEGPTVNLSVSDADLVEGEEFTVNISVDESTGAIPDGGLELFIDSGPTDLGEFNIFGDNGIDPATDLVGLAGFPEQGDDFGGFFVTVVEPEASITLSVFDDGPGEGEEVLTFELADGEIYEVGTGSVELTINDASPDDTIIGTDGDDRLRGTADNDVIVALDGNDRLFADGGSDILDGGDGRDRLFGSTERDILIGGEGDDFLNGEAGDDILMGVTGRDVLVGGGGADLFVFGVGDGGVRNNVAVGNDLIRDFEVGIDKIGLVEGELTFDDITLTQSGSRTLLGVASTGEVLAALKGVDASSLGESSFEIVPNVATVEDAMAIL